MTRKTKTTCLFVIDAARLGEEPAFRYLCGKCGPPLSEYPTSELLDCVFVCPTCRTTNEPPVETPLLG